MQNQNRTNINPEGWAGLKAWNPNFQPHEFPKWFFVRMRGWATARGVDTKYWRAWSLVDSVFRYEFPNVLDHWGRVRMPGEREVAFYTMPYTQDKRLLDPLAMAINASVEILPVSPWNSGTTAFLLRPIPCGGGK